MNSDRTSTDQTGKTLSGRRRIQRRPVYFFFSLLPVVGVLLGLGILGVACGPSNRHAAQVDVTTVPSGAVVFWNGEEVGSSPVTVTGLPTGTHVLTAVRDGHRDARRSLSVMPGQRTAVELRLEPLSGLLHVVSRPEGARVFLDGAYQGQTPLFLKEVPLGDPRMTFEASGYLPTEIAFQVTTRTPRRMEVALVPDAGSLQVRSTPPGATVRLNGVDQGETPLSIPDVPSGEALVEILLPGYQAYSERVRLRAQEERSVAATLEPIPTRLEVVSLPPGARVYVQNRYRGETPLQVADLQPGEYRLRAELRGYEPSARTVRLVEEGHAVEEFRLVRNSGTLVLVTEPPGVRVFLDGEEAGRTRAASDSDPLSDPFEVDLLPPGEYRLQLSRHGYLPAARTVSVAVNEVTEVYETLERRFVTDTRVRIGEVIREGMLLREFPNGDIELQLETGTIMRIQAEEIELREPIRGQN